MNLCALISCSAIRQCMATVNKSNEARVLKTTSHYISLLHLPGAWRVRKRPQLTQHCRCNYITTLSPQTMSHDILQHPYVQWCLGIWNFDISSLISAIFRISHEYLVVISEGTAVPGENHRRTLSHW